MWWVLRESPGQWTVLAKLMKISNLATAPVGWMGKIKQRNKGVCQHFPALAPAPLALVLKLVNLVPDAAVALGLAQRL